MDQPLDLSGLSPRHRRMIALGVHGGDGDDAPDFAVLLERVGNVADLSDADLATLESDLLDAAAALAERARNDSDDTALADLIRCADARDAVCQAAADRYAHAEEVAAQVEAVEARLRGEPADDATPDADDPAATDEPDATAAAAAVVDPPAADAPDADATDAPDATDAVAASAAAPATPVVSRVAARRPEFARPRARHAAPELTLRASANVPGTTVGEALDTPDKIVDVFRRTLQATAGYRGPRVDIPVMSLGMFDAAEVYGEDRTLRYNARENNTKIEALRSREALDASGGVCAPPPIDYTLPVMGSDARPVRDGLLRMGADRGGIRLLPPPLLDDLEGAIGIWTEANDANDGGPDDPAVKPCLRLDCPDEYETMVDAITNCLEIGNFRARFFPEQVTAWVTKASQMHARVAEIKMLDKIGSESTQVATTQVLGTTRDILTNIERACAAIRSRHRLDPDFPMRFMAPAWLRKNMVADLIREAPGSTGERLATSDAEIEGFLRARAVNPSWFLDGETGEGQIFSAQGDGLLLGWPTTVIAYLFIEGQWMYMDGGQLDLGVTRDSTLNATNDFQMFSETFENVVFHGYESYRLEMPICADGTAAALVETSGVCDNGS